MIVASHDVGIVDYRCDQIAVGSVGYDSCGPVTGNAAGAGPGGVGAGCSTPTTTARASWSGASTLGETTRMFTDQESSVTPQTSGR